MDLDDIPHDQRDKFPMGVSEVSWQTETEAWAFLAGLCYADDQDVSHGTPFIRDGFFWVRVRVGDWGDEDEMGEDL